MNNYLYERMLDQTVDFYANNQRIKESEHEELSPKAARTAARHRENLFAKPYQDSARN